MIENLHIRVKHVRGKLEAILTRPGQKVAEWERKEFIQLLSHKFASRMNTGNHRGT
jgi:hypothetical protein